MAKKKNNKKGPAKKVDNKKVDPLFHKKHGNFKVSEYCKTGEMPPKEVYDAILDFHIEEMNPVRDVLGFPVIVSQNSGYRPKEYELSKGRSGNSQHTFEQIHLDGKCGAADYTSEEIDQLVELILHCTNYHRVCYYPNNKFVHCDYKGNGKGKRQYFECESPTSSWKFIRFL